MIARIWRGSASMAKAEDYHRHFTVNVAPHLKTIPGNVGAYLLKRETGAEVEFLAVTLWDSLAAIESFAGADPTVAIVEPEGRATLSYFDDFASHYEVAFQAVPNS